MQLSSRRVVAAVLAAGVVAGLSTACGGPDGASPQATVTVTRGSDSPSATSTPSPTATTDVKGRRFDLGSISSVDTVAGVLVVQLDRWTLPGTTDTAVARDGIKVVPHKGTRYTNQNKEKTYSAPVADGAIAVVNTCVPGAGGELGLESSPQDAAAWLKQAKHSPQDVLVVTYDDDGAITRLDTDPRC